MEDIVGIGFVDFLTRPQVDPETGEELPAFGVSGGNYDGAADLYRKINRAPGVEKDTLYLIRADSKLNTEAYAYLAAKMFSGKVKFLVDVPTAKNKLLSTKVGQSMSPEEVNKHLISFEQTDILRTQLLNLKEERTDAATVNINLKRINSKIQKDKVSSLIYGMYWIKQEEDLIKRKKQKGSIANLMLFN